MYGVAAAQLTQSDSPPAMHVEHVGEQAVQRCKLSAYVPSGQVATQVACMLSLSSRSGSEDSLSHLVQLESSPTHAKQVLLHAVHVGVSEA